MVNDGFHPGGAEVKKTGSQVLFRTLQKENADTIFGYPGGSVMDIYDEMFRQQNIRHILVRHEQGAIHAADGFARASGKVGVCLVTSGPGATNTVTGIANAHLDSIPVVVFTGQVPTHMIGNDAFQEVDITGITRSCTKHNYLVRRIEDLARTVREAFHIARSGRPGPVLVDLPKDVMQSSIEESEIVDEVNLNGTSAYPDIEEDCVRAFKLLKEARRPLVFAGGGIILGKACEDLRAFVKHLRVPVISSLMGLGAFPGSNPLSLGMVGMHGTYYANMAISNCDLLFAVGVRFDDRVTSKIDAFAPHAKIVHIDIDPVSLERTVRTDIPILSGSKKALETFNRLIAEETFSYPAEQTREWLEQVATWKKRVPLGYCRSQRIKPQYVVEKLYEITGGDAIITTEVGQNQMWAAQFYKFDHPNSFITSGGLGTMGFGFPAAIGAQVARPDRTVVDISGDGSLQMNIQELATAAETGVNVKIVLADNQALGLVQQQQDLFYGRRIFASTYRLRVDFPRVAEGFGVRAVDLGQSRDPWADLERALLREGPCLIRVPVAAEDNVYPMVPPGAANSEMIGGEAHARAN